MPRIIALQAQAADRAPQLPRGNCPERPSIQRPSLVQNGVKQQTGARCERIVQARTGNIIRGFRFRRRTLTLTTVGTGEQPVGGQRLSVAIPARGGESVTTPPPVQEDRRFRPDIQGLRAIAVLLVVLYHAGVSGVPGGYVGVNVFFVLSSA